MQPAGVLPEFWRSRLLDREIHDAVSAVENYLALPGCGAVVTAASHAHVIQALEPIVASGLYRREARYVRPPVVLSTACLHDWHAWTITSRLAAAVDLEPSRIVCRTMRGVPLRLAVCSGCAVVFPLRRKTTARYCRMCEKRPPSAPFMTPAGMARVEVGERITFTVPAPRVEHWARVTWPTVTVGRCDNCGELMHGSRNKAVCSDRSSCARRRQVQQALGSV